MANIKPQDLPTNVPEKVAKSYDKANQVTGTTILEKGKEVIEKGKEKVKEAFTKSKEGDLPSNLPEKVKESYRKADLDMKQASLLDKGKVALEKGKQTLEKGKENVKEMFKPELELPMNVPEKVRQSHLEYSTRLFEEQPTIVDKGLETLEKGKELVKEIFSRDDQDEIPSDIPEIVQESHKEFNDNVVEDSETLLEKIENTYELGKEKVLSIFNKESDLPEFSTTTPQLVRDSYTQYEERLRHEEPTIIDKGRDLIKGIFSSNEQTETVQGDVPMNIPQRVRESHLEYQRDLDEQNQNIFEKGRKWLKNFLL